MVPDGRQLLSADQAAEQFNLNQDTIYQLVKRGVLAPARFGTELVFTRADLERYTRQLPELSIVEALERGEGPIAAYMAANGKVKLRELGPIVAEWARVSSFWLVQGPPGSYARWLQRLGLLRVNTTDLRRVIEAICNDDSVALKAQLALDAARSSRLQAEQARARETAARTTTIDAVQHQEACAVSDAP